MRNKEKSRTPTGFGSFFCVTKGNGERIYIQVACEITDKNREREFGNFSSIKDNYPKYVISRDQVQLSENGILPSRGLSWMVEIWNYPW